jgi:thiol-disulfide isomerase/thioredoxin
VVVTFLANHCPAVVAYEDRLIDVAKAYKGKSVKFVGICCTDENSSLGAIDNLDAIRTRIKEKGYNFVYAYDPSGKIGKAYGASVTPQTFVLDKNRVIRYTGAIDDNQSEDRAKTPYLKNAIDAVLAGETVEVTETMAKGCGIKYAN